MDGRPDRYEDGRGYKYGTDSERDEARRLRYRTRYADFGKEQLEEHKVAGRETRRRLRRKVLKTLGGHCIKCGFEDERALQIDHIEGGGRQEHAAIGARGIMMAVLIDSSPYQLLCANCNWIKRTERGEEHREGLREPTNDELDDKSDTEKDG